MLGWSCWVGLSHTYSITDLEPNSSKIHPTIAVNSRIGGQTLGSRLHMHKHCLSRSSVTVLKQNVIQWSIPAETSLLLAPICNSCGPTRGIDTGFWKIYIHQGTCKQYKSAWTVRDKIPRLGWLKCLWCSTWIEYMWRPNTYSPNLI